MRNFVLVATLSTLIYACPAPKSVPSNEVAQSPTKAAESPPIPDARNTKKSWYGIYMQGIKVGWMLQVDQRDDDELKVETRLEAKIRGMGQTQEILVNESRRYSMSSEKLLAFHFEQKAATGSVQISGVEKGGLLVVTTSAGGQSTTTELKVKESIRDVLAFESWLKSAKVSDTFKVTRYDPSLQKELGISHRVLARESRVFGGVSEETIKLESIYDATQITETSWYDDSGRILESQIAGFFVARLEAPDVAKKTDFQQDLLVSAVVKPPEMINRPDEVKSLELLIQGFEKTRPPEGSTQKILSADDKRVKLKLSRSSTIPSSSQFPISVDTSLAKYKEATAFIQSQDPSLMARAKAVVGSTTSTKQAVGALTNFVYDHVKDEYVPAYSNAKEALDTARGDCTEHSILFVAMARALGIPSRVAVGIAFWPAGRGFGWHAWSEVWVDGQWYPVDPTWNQEIADATHIKLADGGPAEQARIVMLLGRLKIDAMKVDG